jgi:transglutaminase-like putative cysteine protease
MVLPVRHRVRYRLTVPAGAPGLRPGAVVRAWLPFPQEYRQQQDVRLVGASPDWIVIAPAAEGEFPLGGAPQRSIFFQRRIDAADAPAEFSVAFEYTSFAYHPRLDDATARPLPPDYAGGWLAERPPHIRFTPEARALAADLTRGLDNPLAAARAVFRWVATHIAYNAEEEYSLIPSLSDKVLTTRRGDCGVQAMAFITLCRAAGVPARWQSGWQTKPPAAGRLNMHDWAEFYIAPWGWLPADPSYGLQDSDDPAVRDFYFGHQDAWRLIVNRDYGCDLFPPKESPRSEPLDFQRGEVEVDRENLYFDRWRYAIEMEREPS